MFYSDRFIPIYSDKIPRILKMLKLKNNEYNDNYVYKLNC